MNDLQSTTAPPATAAPVTASIPRRRVLTGFAQAGAAAIVVRTGLVATVAGGLVASPAPAEAATAMRNPARRHGPDTLTRWFTTLYSGIMDEPTMTPGRAARVYATCAVAGYEAVMPGTQHLRSLTGQLLELDRIEQRRDPAGVDWPTVVSAAVATTAASLLHDSRPELLAALAAEQASQLDARRAAGISEKALDRSTRRGQRVGERVAAWALDDGAEATYAMTYTPPVGPELWRSTAPNFGTAIDPYWGSVRTMALPSAGACAPRPPIGFSTEPGSTFHDQALAVLAATQAATDDDRLTALYWRDNPTTSGLPSGHWMMLAGQLCGDRDLTLPATARVLAMTGIALHDAFISCWHEKYTTNLLRPISYIREHVEGHESWSSYVNTPQFPEYTSGHSVASKAAATVLTRVMGTFEFTDRTHLLRNPQLGTRTFTSFDEAAAQAAGSRLIGGIHYPMGIDEGLVQGRRVGRTVLRRVKMTRRTRG